MSRHGQDDLYIAYSMDVTSQGGPGAYSPEYPHPRFLRAGLQEDRHHPSWLFSRFLGGAIPLYLVDGAALGTKEGTSCGDSHARRERCYNEKHFRKNSETESC
jgi:hypothetical protein